MSSTLGNNALELFPALGNSVLFDRMLHMGQNEFSHLLNSIATLSPDQVQRLYRELESKMASATNVSRPTDDPLLGSMQDHAELMDEIVEDAMRHREQQPWRLSAGE